jgi:hypothetical protein
MKRVILPACAAIVLTVVWAASRSPGDEPKPKPEGDFAPKVLMVICRDPSKGAILGEAKVRPLGGRAFLVGKTLIDDGADSAWSNAPHWLALDEVVEMYEFPNLDAARKAQAEIGAKK